MVRALESQDLEVEVLPWARLEPEKGARRLRKLRRAGKPGHDWLEARDHAFVIRRALDERPVDVILAIAASTQVARLKTEVPIVNSSDTTLHAMLETYPSFTGLSPTAIAQAERIDRVSVQAASRLIYPSEWAARSSIEHCGAERARISVIPYGPNLDAPVEPLKREPPVSDALVLFVGVDWERKGGDTAVAAVAEVRRRGRRARLVCVGAEPPASKRESWITHERFDKSVPAQRAAMSELYAQADLLLLPTAAECFGIVLCEAAAFGVPVVASQVGAIPEIVQHGETGRVVSLDAPVADWADALEAVLDRGSWPQYAAAARRRFEAELNWTTWGGRVRHLLEGVVT
jgi:glycosyltransferase involved in cell wall biosynthesis